MAIKISGSTIIDDSRNIVNAGVITATYFVGDGSSLTGVVGNGSGILIKDDGSTVGVAGTIDFGSNLSVSSISAGVVTVTSNNVGAAGTWAVTSAGINTSKNVGIGTTNPTSSLTVVGDATFSGVVTATRFESSSSGTPTIDSPNNLNINAINVAISTDITIGRDAYVGINTSAGLVLTDSLGIQWRLGVTTTGSLFTTLV